ncbi:RNA polymerase subunit sigma, partial [Paenibacillus sepulcri]|nr:RNA polymerase subunit sigma [Paenibacillus sepulcri]
RLWEAYASPELTEHTRFLEEDTSALPFSRAAFEAHLSRLPSAGNGLGIVEQTTLEYIEKGIHSPYELFREVGDRLNFLGMGDLEYWHRLAVMAEEPGPLLHIEGKAVFPKYRQENPDFGECMLLLTERGRRVRAGEQHWSSPGDEWYGGLHLQRNSLL